MRSITKNGGAYTLPVTDVRAMEPLCWCAAEGTAGVFACAMSGNGEDLINHLDLCDLQFFW